MKLTWVLGLLLCGCTHAVYVSCPCPAVESEPGLDPNLFKSGFSVKTLPHQIKTPGVQYGAARKQ